MNSKSPLGYFTDSQLIRALCLDEIEEIQNYLIVVYNISYLDIGDLRTEIQKELNIRNNWNYFEDMWCRPIN